MVLVVKNPPANTGDLRDAGSIPGSERSPREGNGNPLQYSCLENSMDSGAWQVIVHRVAKSQTRLKRLSMHDARQIAAKSLHLYPTLCNPLEGVCLTLLQGICLTQGSNPRLWCLLYWQEGSLPLSPPGMHWIRNLGAVAWDSACLIHLPGKLMFLKARGLPV